MEDEHEQKHERNPDTLLLISRATIILPALVVIIGLIFVGWQKLITMINPTERYSISPTPIKTSLPIDLNGPYVCSYKSKTSSASAFIDNKKFYAQIATEERISIYVLNGDCIHTWEKNKLKGGRMCGASTLLPLLQFSGLKLPSSQADIISKSCIKKPVPDHSVFNIPKNIQFSDEVLSIPQEIR